MNQMNSHRPPLAKRAIDPILWTVQVLSGVFWSVTGLGKVFWYKPALWNEALHQVPWLSAVPQNLIIFIGVCEFLGGIGMIVPAMTGVKPKLTPFAACGLTLIMIFAAVFHVARGEYSCVLICLLLGGFTAFVAYGRLVLRPIVPAPIGTFRLATGVAVLGALVFVGFAPVWYRLTQMH